MEGRAEISPTPAQTYMHSQTQAPPVTPTILVDEVFCCTFLNGVQFSKPIKLYRTFSNLIVHFIFLIEMLIKLADFPYLSLIVE